MVVMMREVFFYFNVSDDGKRNLHFPRGFLKGFFYIIMKIKLTLEKLGGKLSSLWCWFNEMF